MYNGNELIALNSNFQFGNNIIITVHIFMCFIIIIRIEKIDDIVFLMMIGSCDVT